MDNNCIGIVDIDRRPEVMEIINQLKDYGKLIDINFYDKTELLKVIKKLDLLIIRLFNIDKEIIEKATKLKGIIKFGVGIDHIDVKEATKAGIHIVISPGNHISVAESAILLMIALSRKLIFFNKNTNCNNTTVLGQEMYNKVLGLVGFGRIGKHVCKIALSFGMKVLVYDPYLTDNDLKNINKDNVKKCFFDELLKISDYISIHCPLNQSTFHLFKKNQFKMMKKTAIIVNTARGAIINEEDLYEALKSGIIAGAGLDVFEKEPLAYNNPLLILDNVIATPHRLAQTKESIERQTKSVFVSALKIVKGNIPEDSINKDNINPEIDRLKML